MSLAGLHPPKQYNELFFQHLLAGMDLVAHPVECRLVHAFGLRPDPISHPELDSIAPGIRIFGCMGFMAEMRIRRVLALLNQKEILTPAEWGTARELLNRTYRHFRVATTLVTENWMESLLENCEQDTVREGLSPLPAMINAVKLGVLAGSIVSALLGVTILLKGRRA